MQNTAEKPDPEPCPHCGYPETFRLIQPKAGYTRYCTHCSRPSLKAFPCPSAPAPYVPPLDDMINMQAIARDEPETIDTDPRPKYSREPHATLQPPHLPCPGCGAGPEKTARTGALYQLTPDSPRLEEPVEIRRCYACNQQFRIDGVPYDYDASRQAWAEHHAQKINLQEVPPKPETAPAPRRRSAPTHSAQQELFL